MSDRHDAAARAWLKERKKEDDEHGGLMPRRLWPADTLAASLAALLRSTADEEREQCAKVAESALLPPDGRLPDGLVGGTADLSMRLIAAAIRSRGARGE
jgi:hypothetical protein